MISCHFQYEQSSLIRKIAFFLCGVFVCICDLQPVPKLAVLGCLIPVVYCIYTLKLSPNTKSLYIEGKSFFSWYGLFISFVCLSSFWSPNSISYSIDSTESTIFVYKRIFTPLIITSFYFFLSPNAKECSWTLLGLIFGSFIACVIVLSTERAYIGLSRLGATSYGAGPTFGNVASMGVILSYYFYLKGVFSKLFLLMILFFFGAIALSASRQPLACAVLGILVIYSLKRRLTLPSLFQYCIIGAIFLTLIFFATQKIEFLYNMVGFRIEEFLSNNDYSNNERSIMRTFALNLFLDNPIAGVGIHGFAALFGQWYGWTVWSHCGYTEILSCYGIIGFLFFYSYLFKGGYSAFRTLQSNRLLGALFFSLLVNTLLLDMFYVVFLDARSVFLLGLILQPYTNSPEGNYA